MKTSVLLHGKSALLYSAAAVGMWLNIPFNRIATVLMVAGLMSLWAIFFRLGGR